jgi:type IV secretory pathway TraG/TraD family ATPase VirD4
LFYRREFIDKGEAATLLSVKRLLTEPTSYDAKDKKKPVAGFLKNIHEMAGSSYAPIADSIGQIAERLDDASAGSTSVRDVIGNVVEGMDFLKIPPLARDLQGFNFAELRGPGIVTVYLIIPSEELTGKAAIWLRLVINCALRDLNSDIRPGDDTLPPPKLILDEAFAIGHLDALGNALALGAGNSICLHILLQDLNQLSMLYPKNWRSFLSASGAVTAFAPKDWFTATELARLGGEKTEIVRSISRNGDGSRSTNDTPHSFPLLRPEDLMRMPKSQMVCFVEPEPFPFFTVAKPYVEMEFAKGMNANPYYRKRP